MEHLFFYSHDEIWDEQLNEISQRLENADYKFVAKIASLEKNVEIKHEEVNRHLREESIILRNFM